MVARLGMEGTDATTTTTGFSASPLPHFPHCHAAIRASRLHPSPLAPGLLGKGLHLPPYTPVSLSQPRAGRPWWVRRGGDSCWAEGRRNGHWMLMPTVGFLPSLSSLSTSLLLPSPPCHHWSLLVGDGGGMGSAS